MESASPVKYHLWAPSFTGFGGGITSFSRELAMALRDLGLDLQLVGKTDLPGHWQGLPLRGAGAARSSWHTASFALMLVRSCAWQRPVCIISTHLNFGPIAWLVKRMLGCSYTLIAHGIDVHPDLSWARLRALRAADQVLAVSEWTRQRLLDMVGLEPGQIMLLPNTFNEECFKVREWPEVLVERYALGAGERVILTVARLDPLERYKGYDQVITALSSIQAVCGRVRYVLVGQGDDRARIESLAHDLGVAHSVTFAGLVPDEEMADHYRLADVFAMPSTGEGFGIVFLEAMACGTPVLGGNRDGSVDALDGGRLGRLVNPTDVDEIAAGIIALLQQQGPAWWFDREALHTAVTERFGRAAFRQRLREILSDQDFPLCSG